MLKLETYINCNMNKIHKPVHTKKKDRYITHIQCACVCVCDMQMTFERTKIKPKTHKDRSCHHKEKE